MFVPQTFPTFPTPMLTENVKQSVIPRLLLALCCSSKISLQFNLFYSYFQVVQLISTCYLLYFVRFLVRYKCCPNTVIQWASFIYRCYPEIGLSSKSIKQILKVSSISVCLYRLGAKFISQSRYVARRTAADFVLWNEYYCLNA